MFKLYCEYLILWCRVGFNNLVNPDVNLVFQNDNLEVDEDAHSEGL